MKRFFANSSLFIIACILFSSCSPESGRSVVKRQYKKGYYVSFKNNKSVASKKEIAKNTEQKAVSATTLSSKENYAKNNIEKTIVNKPTIATSATNPVVNKNASAIHKNTSPSSKKVSKRFAALEKKIQKKGPPKNGGGKGLLWTIIVIILILWLAGFLLADVGGILHLLLVIALVLIILRLLGLI